MELRKYKDYDLQYAKAKSEEMPRLSCPQTVLNNIPEKMSKAEEGIISNLNQHLLNVLLVKYIDSHQIDLLKHYFSDSQKNRNRK